jgi:hypothetical protein
MAEVFAYGPGRVVKLDRPSWNGVAYFEADIVNRLALAGLPVARSHGVVNLEGRSGVVLDRVDGRTLLTELVECHEQNVQAMAEQFADLQYSLNSVSIPDLPDLVVRLNAGLEQSGLPEPLEEELAAVLMSLDDGRRTVCHFDFHPLNVLVSANGWVVIDWVGVAAGPAIADVARTQVLWGNERTPPIPAFLRIARQQGVAKHGVTDATCDAWMRVIAGARLAEGFEGVEADWLRAVAAGTTPV